MTAPFALAAGNPMVSVARATLTFEVIAFGLSIPVMTQVSGVPILTAVLAGGGTALGALIGAGTVKRSWGWAIGWLLQLAGVLLGLLTYGMFIIGGLFALLFIVTFVLGRRLASQREQPGTSS